MPGDLNTDLPHEQDYNVEDWHQDLEGMARDAMMADEDADADGDDLPKPNGHEDPATEELRKEVANLEIVDENQQA
jgi:hypothetical protein